MYKKLIKVKLFRGKNGGLEVGWQFSIETLIKVKRNGERNELVLNKVAACH